MATQRVKGANRQVVQIANGANSVPLIVPMDARDATLVLTLGGGNLQYTVSDQAAIDAGTATWADHPDDLVLNTPYVLKGTVMAYRLAAATSASTVVLCYKS